MSLKKILPFFFVLFFIFSFVWLEFGDWKKDRHFAFLKEGKVEFLSFYPQKNKIAAWEMPGELLVWVPEGYGWYPLEKVESLLLQEGKFELWPKLVFLNFGLRLDESFKGEDLALEGLAFGRWRSLQFWRLWWLGRSMLKEKLSADSLDFLSGEGGKLEEGVWEEVVEGDWSLPWTGEEEVTLGIYNGSRVSGWASWLAKRFGWAGWWVTDLGDWTGELPDSHGKDCLFIFRGGKEFNEKKLKNWVNFLDCDWQVFTDEKEEPLQLVWVTLPENWEVEEEK